MELHAEHIVARDRRDNTPAIVGCGKKIAGIG